MLKFLKKTGATILMTSELPEDSKQLSSWGVEEFVCDGVIVLYYTGIAGEESWNLQIRKMRRTNHNHGIVSMSITSSGIKLTKSKFTGLK